MGCGRSDSLLKDFPAMGCDTFWERIFDGYIFFLNPKTKIVHPGHPLDRITHCGRTTAHMIKLDDFILLSTCTVCEKEYLRIKRLAHEEASVNAG